MKNAINCAVQVNVTKYVTLDQCALEYFKAHERCYFSKNHKLSAFNGQIRRKQRGSVCMTTEML